MLVADSTFKRGANEKLLRGRQDADDFFHARLPGDGRQNARLLQHQAAAIRHRGLNVHRGASAHYQLLDVLVGDEQFEQSRPAFVAGVVALEASAALVKLGEGA